MKEDLIFSEVKILEIDLHEAYSKLIKHHRLVLNFIYVCLGIALLYSFIVRPVYKSTARIMIEGKAPKITKVEGVVLPPDYSDSSNYYNSQIEVLKSHAVANLVYDELGSYQPWGSLRGRSRDSNKVTKEERINRLLKTIRINPVRMTQIVEISAEDVDRELAAKIVNSWAKSYTIFSSLDQLIQRRSELESDIEQNLKYIKEKHPIIQGLQSEIDAINAKINGEKLNAFSANVKILDAGQVAKKPVRPRPLLNLIFAFFIGGFGGIGLVFILENMDQSIKNPLDIESFLHMPCLTVLPVYSQESGKAGFPYGLICAKDNNSMFAERLRGLRTSIIYSNPDLKKKVLQITSAGPAEGKSTTAVNLATVFAKTEGKVILIDADLRKPTLHSIFNFLCENGLTDLLAGDSFDFKTGIKKTGITNLDFISCGTMPLNPAELLGSKKFELLVDELSKIYDRIIFDAPPVLAATDAVILSTKVDATIFVFKAGFTHKLAATRSVKLIHSVHSKILGVVLNMVKAGENRYYHYYNHYSQTDKKTQS
ncbi:MAG: polysaccharide biosynthesis tyrosine autokinase [Candidatus Omnitrophota bacterium]|jgi:capsular exopolysaccharide synthesis family protein